MNMLGVKLTDGQYQQLKQVFETDTSGLDTPNWYRQVFLKEFDPNVIKDEVKRAYEYSKWGKFGPTIGDDVDDDDWKNAVDSLKCDREHLQGFLKDKLHKYKDRLQFVGAGFDKLVFVMKDRYVVKISYNDAGQIANEIDFYAKYGKQCQAFLPKLYDWDRKHKMSELVQCAKEMTADDVNNQYDIPDFQYILDIMCGFWTGYDNHVCPYNDVDYTYRKYTDKIIKAFDKDDDTLAEDLADKAISDSKCDFTNDKNTDGAVISDLYSYLNDDVINYIALAQDVCGLQYSAVGTGDFRDQLREFIRFKRANKKMLDDAGKAENWGMVEENGRLRLVLLDIGG